MAKEELGDAMCAKCKACLPQQKGHNVTNDVCHMSHQGQGKGKMQCPKPQARLLHQIIRGWDGETETEKEENRRDRDKAMWQGQNAQAPPPQRSLILHTMACTTQKWETGVQKQGYKHLH